MQKQHSVKAKSLWEFTDTGDFNEPQPSAIIIFHLLLWL